MASRLYAILTLAVFTAPCLADPPAKPRLDAHGFGLPDGAIARLGDLHFAQPSSIGTVALSPDGETIATGGYRPSPDRHATDENRPSSVFLWNVKTGGIVRKIDVDQSLAALAFSTDGCLLAGVDTDYSVGGREVNVWDARTGKRLWAAKASGTTLRFLDADRLLLVASGGSFRLFDTRTGTLVRDEEKHATKIHNARFRLIFNEDTARLAIAPSGDCFAYLLCPRPSEADKRPVIKLYDTVSGRLTREIKKLPFRPANIRLLDDGKTFLLQTERRLYQSMEWSLWENIVFNLDDGAEQFRFPTYERVMIGSRVPEDPTDLLSVHVSPDRRLLFTQDERAMTCRDRATGARLAEWERCSGPAFSRDGARIVVAQGSRLFVYDGNLKPARPDPDFTSAPRLDWRPDGRLLSREWDTGRALLWDTAKGVAVERFPPLPKGGAGYSPCGYDATGQLCFCHRDGAITVHDLATGRMLSRLKGVEVTWKDDGSISPDGARVLIATNDEVAPLLRWFNSYNGREIGRRRFAPREVFPGKLRANWMSADASVFGYLAADGRLAVVRCDAPEGESFIGFPSPRFDNDNAAPSWIYQSVPESSLILAARIDDPPGRVEFSVWDHSGLRRTPRFSLQRKDPINARAWECRLSPDGRLLATQEQGRPDVFLYETATGSPRGRIHAPSDIHYFSFSPDSQALATACEDTSILIWDLKRSLSGLPPVALAAGADKIWQTLGDRDAAVAEQAIWALARAPEEAVLLLRARLRPIASADPGRVKTLIDHLGSDVFREREAASLEIAKFGELAVPALRARLATKRAPLEEQRRIESLLSRLDNPDAIPHCLAELRAIEALENIATPPARSLLAALSTGAPESTVTREAGLALRRLTKEKSCADDGK
ncbi:MAG: WD40 repeat domain-containing protein [Gemmataceae bacterium]